MAVLSSGTQDYSYKFNSVAITGGGYITGIIAHPTEKHLMYTRTDIGSSYRWDEVSQQWIALTDFIAPENVNWLGTESIALDPHDPNRLYLAQGQYVTDALPAAFFVSDDRGATFDIYEAPFPMGSNDLGRNNGERLAVNPFNTNELWMGTRTEGLWKSTDRAKTWTNITNYPDAAGNGIGIVFVIFDPKNSGTIYVGANVPNGLYYTKDHGATWHSIPGQPSAWDPELLYAGHTPASAAPMPMRAILASNGILYVTFADFPGPYAINYGVFLKFNTKTSVWTDITPGTNNTYPAPYKPQAWPSGGFCGISVDSKDPNTLVVVTLDRDPGPALDSMYYSHDGGETYKDVSQLSTPSGSGGYWGHPVAEAALKDGTPVPWLSFNWNSEWGGYGAPSPIVGLTKFGWWMSSVLIYPWDSHHVMYGTGATIWATDELNKVDSNKVPQWYIQAQGIEETAVLALMSPTDGAHLFSGLGDIMGMRHADLDLPQPMYEKPVFSNLNSLDYAGQHPNVVVRVGDSGVSYPNGCGSGLYSKDNGISWTMFPTCVPGVGNQTNFVGLIALDASGQSFVWASELTAAPYNETGPYSTQDYGATWVAPTGLTVMTGNLSADRVQPKTFYAFNDGIFYISKDGGLSYKSTPASRTGLPAGAGAVPVCSFNTAGELWLPLGRSGLWHSTNFGASWTQIGPRSLVAKYFSIGKSAPGRLHPALFLWGQVSAGGVEAIFRSDDAGVTWARINDDAHQYGGAAIIQGDPRVYGRVYMGMFGRGIVYADIAGGGKDSV
ncbi:putative oligoxyloglucan-reducing end-specific xyloglucanase [Hyaloscypha finlandica]|nr:putative oligoxyloglucan-reducing end-specific xyloglucanase [Hyaloscypha finlandica]